MITKNKPLLSFAIPTYNFGKFISETVKTIEDGAEILAPSQFEIVILDGGSKDNTNEVVHKLIEKYENIRYIQHTERGGIDRDMNTVANLTRGKYIWLFSSDDLLEPGWDKSISPLLEKGGDVLLVPAMLCDIKMSPLRPNPIFKDCTGQDPVEFDISPHDNSLNNYLNRANTLEALFSFMGAVLVNANIWRSLPERTDYFGSCWAHCVRLTPLFFRKTKIIYLNQFLIKKRSGNDSFMENGIIARIAIAVDGWDRIIQEFFNNTAFQQKLYNALRKDMPILIFIYAKISAKDSSGIKQLNSMARLLYTERSPSSNTKFKHLVYRLTPASSILNAITAPFVPLLIRIRRKIKAIFK